MNRIAISFLICAVGFTGCSDQTVSDIQSQVAESSISSTIIEQENSKTAIPKVEIEVGGETLPFPFQYGELDKLIDLSDAQTTYFAEAGFTICTVYNVCTLFVQGDLSEKASDALVTYININHPEKDIFSINGLKDDTMDSYISQFGETYSTDVLWESSWDHFVLSVLFDKETGKAYDIRLLDMDYPHSL